MRQHYDRALHGALRFSKLTWLIALASLVAAVLLFRLVGGEFMPALEEGNLWIRATMQQDISFQQSEKLTDDIREILRQLSRDHAGGLSDGPP